MIFIYLTTSSIEESYLIAKELLKKKLIACVNVFPIESLFYWEAELQQKKEYGLILKTLEPNFDRVEKEILELHSNEIPCISKIKVDSLNKSFFSWIQSEVSLDGERA